MKINSDFYVFEVIEEHIDYMVQLAELENIFIQGSRFIGWENKDFKKAVKSNMEELICIPLDKVKKVYKINFEEIVD